MLLSELPKVVNREQLPHYTQLQVTNSESSGARKLKIVLNKFYDTFIELFKKQNIFRFLGSDILDMATGKLLSYCKYLPNYILNMNH